MLHQLKNKLHAICLIATIMLLPVINVNAQQTATELKNDLALIDTLKCKHHHHHKRTFIYANQPITFKTHNPVSLLYGGMLYLYQNTISQHFSADCIYSPSCSEFSKLAVQEFGIIKGGLLSFDRLNRCTRLSAADIHPSMFDPKTHLTSDPISKYK